MSQLPIALFNPASCRRRNRRFPLSLYALLAPLRAAGYDPLVVDGNLSNDPIGEIVDHLSRGPGILATTVMPGPQVVQAYAAAQAVKARNPRATVAWGGSFASMHLEVCLKSRLVDFVVKGRGEIVLLDLARAIEAGGDGRDVGGASHLGASGVVTPPAGKTPHPDDVPQFDYTGVPISPYLTASWFGKKTAVHTTGYGCAWACNFCAVTAVYGRKYKALSPELAVKPLHYLAENYGADSVEFFDMDFFIHQARTLEIAERMPRNWHWWAWGRADEMLKLPHAAWQTLKASGMAMIYMGAESGSATVLKRMRKDLALEEVIEAARRFGKYGVKPEFSFVLGNPVDPETDVRESIEFIRKLRRINPDTEIQIYKYTPMPIPGEMFEQSLGQGFRYPDTLEEWLTPKWQAFSTMTKPQTPWLSAELNEQIDNFFHTLQAYHPSPGMLNVGRKTRLGLKALAAWRYQLGIYDHPYEIKAALRLARYLPPSREGFARA
jgi:anaerobic magnesium-protoporphyrin IX monomethyl ester cyclase